MVGIEPEVVVVVVGVVVVVVDVVVGVVVVVVVVGVVVVELVVDEVVAVRGQPLQLVFFSLIAEALQSNTQRKTK